MLSKICSQVARYSHTPGVHVKTHRTQRLMNTGNRSNSRIAQLSQECMSDLRAVEINPSLQSRMKKLQAKYCEDLKLLTEAEYNSLPDHAIFEPDGSMQAQERAEAVQLYRGVGAVASFLDEYSVHSAGMALVDAISLNHKDYLIHSFHKSFAMLNPSDQLALVSAIRPDVLSKMDVPCSREGRQLSIANQQAGKDQLDEHHLLSLLDYCSSSTGCFHAINDSLRVWQLCGIDKLATITSCMATAFKQALEILSTHQAFVYEGPTWKGIALLEPAGPYRMSKIQPGMSYTSPHWSSVTCIESKNYTKKADGYRSCKLSIAHSRGVRVHMFNDISSIDEGEVMLPPKPMYFFDGPEKRFNGGGAAMHVYCTMKPEPPDTNTLPSEPHAIRV